MATTRPRPLVRVAEFVRARVPARLRPGDVAVHVVLLGVITVLFAPIALAALFSTQTVIEIYQIQNLAPGTSTAENYRTLFAEYDFGSLLFNSLVMSIVIVAGKLSFSLLTATALVYYDFPYQRYVFYAILFTLMMPIPVRLVPLYQLFVDWGWTNTFQGLTAPYIASATSVFLFRQRFRSIPASIVETAKIDGIGPLKFLVRVLLPMSKGMVAGIVVIMFISMWNKYLWPLVIISDSGSQVVQVGLRFVQGAAAGGLTQWNLVMAGAMVALIPPLVVLVLARKPLLNTFGVR
jgi:sn-glycerol 3-phosphate transport system permease protein